VATGNVRSIAFIVVSGGRPDRTLAAFLIGYQLNRGYRTARQNLSKCYCLLLISQLPSNRAVMSLTQAFQRQANGINNDRLSVPIKIIFVSPMSIQTIAF
jgi:hypothetical protein